MSILAFALVLIFGFVSQNAFADSRLTIVKYGLSPGASGFSENQTTNDGLKINNLPLDNLGNELSVVSGIHYLVYEISPTGVGKMTFASGSLAFIDSIASKTGSHLSNIPSPPP